MRDRRVQNLVNVAQELVFVNFDLLSRLLHNDYLRVALLEATGARLDLKVAILVVQLHAGALP